MNVPTWHILVCSSSRLMGEPRGGCQSRGAAGLAQYLQEEIGDRGIGDVLVTNTGCLQVCDDGPVMVIYPPGWWYGQVDEDKIDRILDALEEGESVPDLLLNP